MENAKFVRKIYPHAKCITRHVPSCAAFYEPFMIRTDGRQLSICRENIGWGSSIRKAWEDAAQIIKDDTLRKLEW